RHVAGDDLLATRFRRLSDAKGLRKRALDGDQTAAWLEGPSAPGEGDSTGGVEDDIPGTSGRRKVGLGVVDHAVRPKRGDQLCIGCAGHPRHIGTEMARDLHRSRAHCPRSPNNENTITGLYPRLVA